MLFFPADQKYVRNVKNITGSETKPATINYRVKKRKPKKANHNTCVTTGVCFVVYSSRVYRFK